MFEDTIKQIIFAVNLALCETVKAEAATTRREELETIPKGKFCD